MKTAFRFRLRLRRLRSPYDLVKTRLSEPEVEAEEPNQSQSMGTCIVIGLSFHLLTGLFEFQMPTQTKLRHSWNSGVQKAFSELDQAPQAMWDLGATGANSAKDFIREQMK